MDVERKTMNKLSESKNEKKKKTLSKIHVRVRIICQEVGMMVQKACAKFQSNTLVISSDMMVLHANLLSDADADADADAPASRIALLILQKVELNMDEV